MIPKNHELRGTIAFAYEDSIALGSEMAAVSLHRGLDQEEGDSEGDVVMGDMFDKTSSSEKSEPELSAFTLQTTNVLTNG